MGKIMKKNIFQIALIALSAGVLALSCAKKEQPQDSKIQTPVLASISADSYFTSGSATVKAVLSQASTQTVTITLEPGSALSKDYTTAIDSELITIEDIVIPAGQLEGTATVIVNGEDLEKGKYETQIVATSIVGANLSSKATANILFLTGVSVATVEFDAALDADGTTTFTVSLDMPSETDCEVSLGYFTIAGYPFADEEAVSFDKTVTVEAGETEASGKFALDLDKLPASGVYYVALEVTGVSEGPFEAGDGFDNTGIRYTLPVNMTETWIPAYIDKEYYEGDYMECYFQKAVSTPYYDYYVTSADVVEEEEEIPNSFVFTNLIADENDYLSAYLAKYTPAVLANAGMIKASTRHYFYGKDRDPGEYKLWILGLDEKGVCTGEYAVADFEVVADTPEFATWLGKWVLKSTEKEEKPVVVSINTAEQNAYYTIDGLEGLSTASKYLTAFGEIDEESGALYIFSNYSYYGGSYLWYQNEDEEWCIDLLLPVNLYGGPSLSLGTLATAMLGADGNGYLTPGSQYGITTTEIKYYTYNDDQGTFTAISENTTYTDDVLVPYVEQEEEEPAPTFAGALVPREGRVINRPDFHFQKVNSFSFPSHK